MRNIVVVFRSERKDRPYRRGRAYPIELTADRSVALCFPVETEFYVRFIALDAVEHCRE